MSSLAIKIYNMDSINESPIACTVVDLFDIKGRLRQGTWNLMLYPNQTPDYSLKCGTPALSDHESCVGINRCLR
jgi:hypothetical protein